MPSLSFVFFLAHNNTHKRKAVKVKCELTSVILHMRKHFKRSLLLGNISGSIKSLFLLFMHELLFCLPVAGSRFEPPLLHDLHATGILIKIKNNREMVCHEEAC